VLNRKTKQVILLEFKRTADTSEMYYEDMRAVAEKQHTPILVGLNALAEERGWKVEVMRLVAGQRSVREREWLESLKSFGISAEEGRRIVSEHEKLFGSYWRQGYGPPSSLADVLRKGLSVRAVQSKEEQEGGPRQSFLTPLF
jgi:hypothetical protein